MNAEAMVLTVDALLRERAADDGAGLKFEDTARTWAECVVAAARCADALAELVAGAAVPHVGILADNIPEFSDAIGGAALSGVVLVALNDTRSGRALARDVAHTDCAVVLADQAHLEQVRDIGVPVIQLDGEDWRGRLHGASVPDRKAAPGDLLMLVFTSGTSGDPKAVRLTHSAVAGAARYMVDRCGLTPDDVAYVSMPLFHTNALITGWGVALAAGAALALRRRFSARGFLPDVRRFGATYANYVGAPLAYILATEERPGDADNPLRIVYGNEGRPGDTAAFARRFGCRLLDGYGSSELGIVIARTPDTPPEALGVLPDGADVLHADDDSPCPPARFGPGGELLNAAAAVGELVNTAGAGGFHGYYNDDAANAVKLRGGWFRTGDLAYVDDAGFVYFAGRTGDWLRVAGENLGTAPIERVLLRHPDISEVAVYALPAEGVGDQVAAAVVLRPGASLDAEVFAGFVAAQPDLSVRQRPTRLRVESELPHTASFKVAKRSLVSDGVAATVAVPPR
ncbi:AMP-binding protein [Tsukamurella sp. 8J]|uniref:AMP-binding protein n=1 Tax=Tsukamurella sp. 8J TaxID=3031962 RepID=UPI0023BA1A38|nr:AMP-binding protein [Tsukamurella sp. 8J]MDF0530734.1 AMP-binding protein [Tsukamurella sp. 8J]